MSRGNYDTTTQRIYDTQRLERWKISTFSSGNFPRTRLSVIFRLLSLDFYLRVVFTVKPRFLYRIWKPAFVFFCFVVMKRALLSSERLIVYAE